MVNQIMTEKQRQGFDVYHAGQLGQQLANKVHCIKAKYSFAVDGGAVGSIVLNDEFGNPVIIPNGAIVKNVLINVSTAFTTTAGTGTVALALNAANDLLSAIDADTMTTMHAGIPINTAATVVKATAQRNIVMGIATNAVLSGIMDVYIDVLFMG